MLTERLGLPFRRVPVALVNEFSSTLSLRRNALPMLLDVLRLRTAAIERVDGVPAPRFRLCRGGTAPEDKHSKVAA